jgi:hypothetical protein
MSYPGQLFEDPSYDEDGVLIDEDQDSIPVMSDQDLIEEILRDYDPFGTINS